MSFTDTLFRAFERPVTRAWVIFFTLCLTILVVNREMVWNGFSVLSGDRYDAVISTSLLEHWFNVFTGHAGWSKVLYFHPYDRTIAHTDAYFLIGVAYFPFRLFGLDPFLSAEMAGVVIKAIGFVGMYAFMRRVLKVSFGGALLAAAVFSLSNAMTAHSSRLQLASVAFAPVVALAIGRAWECAKRCAYRGMVVHASLACVLMGAWCMTCFYMAWFFFYLFTVFVGCAIAFNWRESRALLGEIFRHAYAHVGVIALVACVSIAPFVYAFLPKSREVGVRAYHLVIQNAVNPVEMFQLGPNNLLLGPLYCRFLKVVAPEYVPVGEYYNTGVSLLLFALFAAAIFRFRKKKTPQEPSWVKYLACATVLTWFSVLKFGDVSPWFVVFHFFPGAKALNAIGVYQIMLAFPVVVVAVTYWDKLKKGWLLSLALPALLILGELNHPYLNLRRADELNKIKSVTPPPSDCTSFYVSGWSWQTAASGTDNLYGHNVTAMMVAQKLRLPTLNGFASFNPPDWCFGYPNDGDYNSRVLAYARRHGVLDGLYRLDLNTKVWTPAYDPPPQVRAGDHVLPDAAGHFGAGWSYSEHTHRWSDGDTSAIRFLLHVDPGHSLRLVVTGHPLGRQHAEVRLNGSRIWSGTVSDSGFPPIVPDANLWKAGLNRLEFVWSDSRLPGNGDPRRLAFAFESLALEPVTETLR